MSALAATTLSAGGPEADASHGAAARAAASAVVSGGARFEVLSPTLIRTEYAGDAGFVDAATFNAVGRDGFRRTPFSRTVRGGWLTLTTPAVTLRYKIGSGQFTPQNLTVELSSGRQKVTASPWSTAAKTPAAGCGYGAVCEAEAGTLGGSASAGADRNGYAGTGFASVLQPGASDTVRVTGVPSAGRYALQLRYSTAKPAPGTVSVAVNSDTPATASLPATSGGDSWRTEAVPVTLAAGTNDVAIGCAAAAGCGLGLDTVAVTRAGSPPLSPHAPLGGYRRGLDKVDGSAPTTPGLLYQDGWALLDDTTSALYDRAAGRVTPRPGHGGAAYQDGYVFGYGHDYRQGLSDLAGLTGPSELLPRWAYGVWYSEYYDRTAADYENTILPAFRAAGVPLDVLVTDTDFKSPDPWNGWEIDPAKYPDPKAFFDWAAAQGLHNTLNIHPSVESSDPQYAKAQATAKGTLTKNNTGCRSDHGHGADCYTFDWGDPDQLTAYLDLHKEMERQGADFWWLDWCCDGSRSTLAGVTPDSWINQQYAQETDPSVGRGFAFSRAYGSLASGGYSGPSGLPTGPWADKRTTVHFTGDAVSDWDTLRYEVGYTPGESVATGLSAVSNDIGGFRNDGTQQQGAEPGSTKLPDDLYARWVQLGTFQPVDRLHGNHSDRLPWQYGPAAQSSAAKFLNLRENLVPYTYTLARQAERTGVPVVRPAYLMYPEEQDAYATAGSEYLYGPDMLVAPVTTPGASATTPVWFPPGRWTDYFTGRTYTGPATAEVTTGLDSMPVFTRAGAIVPARTGNVANDVQHPLTEVTLDVAAGADGSFGLYEDDGTTAAGAAGATTVVSWTDHARTLTIAPRRGSYPGAVDHRSWAARIHDVASAPARVTVNGAPAGSTFDAASRTLTVRTASLPVSSRVTISYR